MMTADHEIRSPEDTSLEDLCRELRDHSAALEAEGAWPGDQLQLCAQHGVFRWFLPVEWGGQAWTDRDLMRGYMRLSAACLTTAFVITQLTGASRRIAVCENDRLKSLLLPNLASGAQLATLGISHLTTSRRHLAKPVLHAEERDDSFVLNGFSPWVTAAPHADVVVTGAILEDGRGVLLALPLDLPGIRIPSPAKLVAISASQTGPVQMENVHVPRQWLIDGPVADVMNRGDGTKTGGLQTSALAIGLASAAIQFLNNEVERRPELVGPAQQLESECAAKSADLLKLAEGNAICSLEEIRAQANSLVLRATQAALAAAKGTGFVSGHQAGRWCREALFFLVWSCPQAVMKANLCELAGISD